MISISSQTLYRWFVKPRSKDEDAKRREFILNVLLIGLLGLSLAALGIGLTSYLFDPVYRGTPPTLLITMIGVFAVLLVVARRGFYLVSSYIFLGLVFIVSTYPLYVWGINLPAGLLMYLLLIVMSGVLISKRFAIYVTLVLSSVLMVLAYLGINHIIHPNTAWMKDRGGMTDAIVYSSTFGLTALVSWLFNREIEKSLTRARRSEKALRRERDLLEVTVAKRTHQLQLAQADKIAGIYRFVELGRLSSDLLHDLTAPLSAVSLNLEALGSKERSQMLQQALTGIKQIEIFVGSARKQVQGHDEHKWFSVLKECRQVITMLDSKARVNQVKLKIPKSAGQWRLFGDSIKFYQAIVNLISNAIDAYENDNSPVREVVISLERQKQAIKITIHNGGWHIPPEDLPRIFEPFFTTKKAGKGTGIGLVITKKIIEEDFYGSIRVTSSEAKGTDFTIRLPLVNYDAKP